MSDSGDAHGTDAGAGLAACCRHALADTHDGPSTANVADQLIRLSHGFAPACRCDAQRISAEQGMIGDGIELTGPGRKKQCHNIAPSQLGRMQPAQISAAAYAGAGRPVAPPTPTYLKSAPAPNAAASARRIDFENSANPVRSTSLGFGSAPARSDADAIKSVAPNGN